MPDKFKHIVLFTSQDIGFQLTEFVARRADVKPLVVTMRTKRDEINGYRSAVDVCVAHGIPHVVTSQVTEAVCSQIKAHDPILVISAYYPAIIPTEVVTLPRFGAINIHPGILPHYRGRFPTPWYILNGETHFGMAIHLLDNGIDTGNILVQRKFPISDDETGYMLYRRSMDEGAAILIESFDALLSGSIRPTPQEGTGSYYRTIEMRFHIDWNMSRTYIARRVRVHARPYLPAYAYLFNRIVLINRVSFVDLPSYSAQGGGQIVNVWPEGQFAVSCCDGCLRVEDYSVSPPFETGERELHIRTGNLLD